MKRAFLMRSDTDMESILDEEDEYKDGREIVISW